MTAQEKERIQKFLSAFKKLEKEVIAIADIRDDYVSFSRALNHIYYHRINPVIAQRENYDLLKTASDVRNILSHEQSPIVPSEEFLTQFLSLSEAIVNPLDCYEVSSKHMLLAGYSTRVIPLMQKMVKEGISHVPVLNEDGSVGGIFSRDTYFDYLSENPMIELLDDTTVGDFRSALSFEAHQNDRFVFVDRYLSVSKAFHYLLKDKPHQKAVALLLVTAHGKKDEKLLGLITVTDLAKLSAKNII